MTQAEQTIITALTILLARDMVREATASGRDLTFEAAIPQAVHQINTRKPQLMPQFGQRII